MRFLCHDCCGEIKFPARVTLQQESPRACVQDFADNLIRIVLRQVPKSDRPAWSIDDQTLMKRGFSQVTSWSIAYEHLATFVR